MCGGVSIDYNEALREELREYFSEVEIDSFAKKGEIVFAYWDKQPLLPVKSHQGIKLIKWGNRDGDAPLPKTGWAKLESLLEHKWDHLQPKVVLIPAKKGCEKKVWFDIHKDIKAVLIQKGGHQRVYMITEAATKEYLQMTGHERMPRVLESEGESPFVFSE